MVRIDEARTANANYYHDRPLTVVSTGGTKGIGEYAVRALCKLYSGTGTPLRIYIVGRNSTAADQIITECRQTCAHAELIFIKSDDLSSIRNVDSAVAQITELEEKTASPRVDLLISSQGELNFYDRTENSEGLEKSLSLVSYSRFRFVQKLMPLLEAASRPHVISVYAAGKEGSLIIDDLGLRNNYKFFNARSHGVIMTTFFFEKMAREHPKIAFVHNFPSIVVTPTYYDQTHPLWFRLTWTLFGPFVKAFLSTNPDDSGTRTLFLGTDRYAPSDHQTETADLIVGTDGKLGSGAYSVNETGEPNKLTFDYGKARQEDAEEKIWQHLMQTFDDIAKNGKTLA